MEWFERNKLLPGKNGQVLIYDVFRQAVEVAYFNAENNVWTLKPNQHIRDFALWAYIELPKW